MNTTNTQQDELQTFISDGTPQAVIDRYASLVRVAQDSDYGDLDRNIVVIDTETTGVSFHHDELTQIAAARMEQGEIVDWFVTFVNPGKPIPEDVAHLTNIHDDDVADAPLPDDALAQLVEFVGDAKLVAHNAEFDRTFTTRHPSGYPLLENTWLDSLDLARIALPRLKSHRLLDLVRAFGAPLSTHRADADVAATCAMFRILLAAVDAMPRPLVQRISELAPADEWPTQVVFAHFAQEADDVSRETRSSDNTGEIAFLRDEPRQAAKAPRSARFSLQALRAQRLSALKPKPHEDADAIAADPHRDLVFPSEDDVAQAFSPDGLVGALYDHFEPRAEQVEMAQAVRAAYDKGTNLVVEAGTGVGKSMAYLVPSTLTALRNHITVGVATKTNALLDQLVFHELPALAQALREKAPELGELTYAPLKGFSHYPCLRRVERIARGEAEMKEVAGKEVSQAPSIAALLSYIEQTDYDDIDGLKIDYRVLPRRAITTTSNDCLRRKCPFFGTSCFVHGSRRRAESADIVVTNHSLLFCDLVADGGLLPPIRYWVVDEAHGAEVEARRAFSVTLDGLEISRLAERLSADESSRNPFVRAERTVAAPNTEEGQTLFYGLTAKARAAGTAYAAVATDFVTHMKDLVFFDPNKRGKGYDTVDIWINDDVRSSATFGAVAEKGRAMGQAADKLIRCCQNVVAYLEDIDGAAEPQREIASLAIDLKSQVNAIDVILEHPSDAYAYAAVASHKKDRIAEKLEALLVNVGEKLNDTLFARTHSVVFASATLSVNHTFTPFLQALGIGDTEQSQADTLMLDSSYDFDGHMTVYVAKDMPEPNDPTYLPSLQQLLVAAHRAQRGSMLTLFTNRREMERCFDAVQPQLKEDDLRVVCQKWGVSVKGLRDDFLKDEHLSLFALKSFWEGFDAPGDTLKGVIIPKLPFSKPTDPLSCERAARDDAAWRRFVLPAAILETKQAAGRLIRNAEDRGVLILADHRLVSKGYGKMFLRSLPSKTIKVLPMKDIVAALSDNQR